jgi:purine/pyrimidine-nucleoside phosphorylase
MIVANEYFNEKVKSLGYSNATGESTVGVMEVGEYEFSTSSHETMYVIEGELNVLLPGSDLWKSYMSGTSFEVAAGASFKVKTLQSTSYLCKYK